jgi:hypothetical protein
MFCTKRSLVRKKIFWPLTFWPFGLLAFWPFGLLAFWPFGLLAFWPFGLLAFWPFDLLAFWTFKAFYHGSFGPFGPYKSFGINLFGCLAFLAFCCKKNKLDYVSKQLEIYCDDWSSRNREFEN